MRDVVTNKVKNMPDLVTKKPDLVTRKANRTDLVKKCLKSQT